MVNSMVNREILRERDARLNRDPSGPCWSRVLENNESVQVLYSNQNSHRCVSVHVLESGERAGCSVPEAAVLDQVYVLSTIEIPKIVGEEILL